MTVEDKFNKELDKLEVEGFSKSRIFTAIGTFVQGVPNKISLMCYVDEGSSFFSGSSLRSKVALAIYNSLDSDDQFAVQEYINPEAFT